MRAANGTLLIQDDEQLIKWTVTYRYIVLIQTNGKAILPSVHTSGLKLGGSSIFLRHCSLQERGMIVKILKKGACLSYDNLLGISMLSSVTKKN